MPPACCPSVFSYGIAVAPALRRRGVARGALSLLLDGMRGRGFTRAVVRIAPDNAASLALHASLGFLCTGEEEGALVLERAL